MTHCTICECSYQPLKVRLNPLELDERLAFVEHTLALLIESRFGRDRNYDTITRLEPSPGPRDEVFYFAADEGFLPPYSITALTDDKIRASIEFDLLTVRMIADARRASGQMCSQTQDRGP